MIELAVAAPAIGPGLNCGLGMVMTDNRPLVVVGDERLLDEVLRLAAAAACEVECAADVSAARAIWAGAPLVIVDEAALGMAEPELLACRSSVVLVCPDEPAAQSWQRAFVLGVRQVVQLPAEESSLVTLLADVAEGASEAGGRVLAVIGGRGGAGASVFASAVGIEAARKRGGALLVDCDGLAGGIDLVLGAEHEAGLRWPDLGMQSGRVSMSALREALPVARTSGGELVLLSCDRDGRGPTPDGTAAVLDAGLRAGYTVICDLPRDPDPAGWQAIDRSDLVVVVVPAEVRASTSARRIVDRLADRARNVGLVVRGPAPDALSVDAIVSAVGAEALAVMRAEPNIAKDIERAEFGPKRTGPLARGAREVLSRLWAAEPQQAAA